MSGIVVAVHGSKVHNFSKQSRDSITLLAGLGVEGDVHAGKTVQHRSRIKLDPSQPNLRQVHLIHAELRDAGFAVQPGDMGENVTLRGVDLLGLPTATRLHLGASAVVELTGLRNPCIQLDRFQPGLMAATLDRDADGKVIRKAGVMSVVIVGGELRPGDPVAIRLPPPPHQPLDKV